MTSSSMGGVCNRILCNGSLAPWHQGLGLEEREIPGTGPQERLDLPLLGVEGPGSVFSPPLPILPLGDSCMGGGGDPGGHILGLAHTPGLLGIQL